MFARRMGAGNLHIALLNALPPLVAIFVLIPGGLLIERLNRKRTTVMALLLLNGVFYVLIAFVPLIPYQAKVMVYVILIGLMNAPGSLYNATWQSFYADHFHGSEANRLYSVRSKYGMFAGLLTVMLTGWILTKLPGSEEQRLMLYQVFYGICFVLTIVQIYFFAGIVPARDADRLTLLNERTLGILVWDGKSRSM